MPDRGIAGLVLGLVGAALLASCGAGSISADEFLDGANDFVENETAINDRFYTAIEFGDLAAAKEAAQAGADLYQDFLGDLERTPPDCLRHVFEVAESQIASGIDYWEEKARCERIPSIDDLDYDIAKQLSSIPPGWYGDLAEGFMLTLAT